MSWGKGIRLLVAGLVVALTFAGLVHAVLVAAGLAQPAATTVYGLTLRRLWASSAAALALAGVVTGGLALRGAGSWFTAPSARRRGALVAVVCGVAAALNGLLNIGLATGGPGTGNGVVGGAAAVVLGLAAIVSGALAMRPAAAIGRSPVA